ncbi:MAG: hypothetical protein R3E42_16045 [Burkholderiaceae bacterium]
MTSKTWLIPWMAAAALASASAALAAPGPKEACGALAERAAEAVALKKQGQSADQAVSAFASQPVPASVPAAQHGFYQAKLPGATRFAFMAGMSADGAAQFYLKQCLKGS